MYEGGIGTMNYSISNNAEYGEYVTGPKVIDERVKDVMREALARIQSGEYAKDFVLENRAGAPTLLSRRRMTAEHPIETVGGKLRDMMECTAPVPDQRGRRARILERQGSCRDRRRDQGKNERTLPLVAAQTRIRPHVVAERTNIALSINSNVAW